MCEYLVFMTYVGRFSPKSTSPRWNVSCLLVYYRRSEHCAMQQQRQPCSWQVWRLWYGRYCSVARTSVQQVGQWNRLGICPLRYATEPSGGIWEGISLVLPRLVVPWSHSLDAKQRGSEPSADSEYEMDCLSKAQSTTCLLGTPGTISEHLSQ